MPGARTPSGIPKPPGPPRKPGGGRPRLDLAGRRFGQLLVIGRGEKPASRSLSCDRGSWWRCSCVCGQEVVVASERVRRGKWACRH